MTVVTILPRQNRSGIFISSNLLIPSNAEGWYWLRTNILTAQITDTLRSLSFLVEVSSDNGFTWSIYCGLTWEGTVVIWKGTGNPGVVFYADGLRNKLIRVTVAVSDTTQIGLELETP